MCTGHNPYIFRLPIGNMNVFQSNGVHLDGIRVDIQRATKAPEHAVITHAHADHVSLNKKTQYFMTPETHDLVNGRFGTVQNPLPTPMEKKVEMEDCSFSLHSSGHILGSVQTRVENSSKVVYTSDFKLQDSLLMKGAAPLDADILVIESTFGLPQYTFPNREEVCQEMGNWINRMAKNSMVVLAGYSLGKAQELTKIVNEYTDHTPLVHDSVFQNNEVYKKYGKSPGNYYMLDHNLNESNVLILPPSIAKQGLLNAIEYSVKKPVHAAMATGWGYRSHYDCVFPISDHADFNQLLEYVQYSSPKQVYTTHGFERELARSIEKKLGIPAKPLSQAQQKSIQEFA
jgi:putative mRNA 3-end processing factor